MKKLISIAAAVVLAAQVHAAGYNFESFLRGPVLSLMISNNVGATNINTLIQTGTTLTNASGVPTNVTVQSCLMWTSAPPTYVNGVLVPGTLIVVTNNSPYNGGTATNGIQFVTNSTYNVFRDVQVLPMSAQPDDASQPGAASASAGGTNIAGTVVFVSLPADTTSGSNIVTAVFDPVLIDTSALGNGEANELTDYAFAGGGNAIVVSYTNALSAATQTTYACPIPRYLLRGCNGLRLRSLTAGSSTHGVWIRKVLFVQPTNKP